MDLSEFWDTAKGVIGEGLYICLTESRHMDGIEYAHLSVMHDLGEPAWSSKDYSGRDRHKMLLMELKLWIFANKTEELCKTV